MKISKYAVFATILLLTLSSSVSMVSAKLCPITVCLPAASVDTHGPRINAVLFSVVSSDGSLKSGLIGNAFQGPEWTFSVGSYTSLLTNTNVGQGTVTTYSFDGIGFNTLRPYMNNINFRQAMAWLTSYSYIQTTVLSGVGGLAGIGVLPCAIYPGACWTGVPNYHVSNWNTNALNAYKLMVKAGLHPGNLSDVISLGSIPNWYMGPGYAGPLNTYPCSAITTATACQFHPLFWYRADDPLRTGVATQLCSYASLYIGFHINCQGTYGSGGHIYGPAALAVVSPGVYIDPINGNTAPVWDSAATNGTAAVNVWDMYTYGWITSANYVWASEFFNSQFAGTTVNFVNFFDKQTDIYSNALLYATTIAGAKTAATNLAKRLQVELPYLMSFYQNTLWAVRSAAWTGYANVPSVGPNTVGGLFYTLLNVHPTNNAYGGTYRMALHQVADTGGMNPLYNTNWVWQADVWASVYDTALGTLPKMYTTVNSYFNWMTTGFGSSLSQWVTPFTGSTGTGGSGGWFNMQGDQGVTNYIHGQKITFHLRTNNTFTDNVPVTAYDYNFSLFMWGVSLPPSIPDNLTPLSGILSGTQGLWATHVVNPYTIELYINSSSVWNLANTQVAIFPQHIFQHFNIDTISTASAAADITQPLNSSAIAGCACTVGTAPLWLQSLPNLMVGSSAFYLTTYNGITGAGQLLRNTGYMRASWKVAAGLPANLHTGTSFTFNFNVKQWTVTPLTATTTSAPTYVNIANLAPSGTLSACSANGIKLAGSSFSTLAPVYTGSCVLVYSKNGQGTALAAVHAYAITNLGGGAYKAVISGLPAHTATPAHYEIIVIGHYTYLGLQRSYFFVSGFTK